jgi:hypothetical protein
VRYYSKNKIIPALTLILAIVCGAAFASSGAPKRAVFMQDNSAAVSGYFTRLKGDNLVFRRIQSSTDPSSSFDIRNSGSPKEVDAGKKNVRKAFLYSFVVPGAGQIYTGSEIKAVLFLGVEALGWTGYFTYQSGGDDKTRFFESYADTYWSRQRYAGFLDSVPPEYHFTHELPETNTQQYYEMIGKYDQFVYGWDDTEPQPPDYENIAIAYSAHRLHYEDMRHDANKQYDRATKSLILVMFNHLVSGFEAALAAKRHNDRSDMFAGGISIEAQMTRIDYEQIPMLTVTYTF